MTLEVVTGAAQVSDALGELSREVARSLVLVRGSRASAGSGVVWDRPQGDWVLTNHHVVPGPTAHLTLSDGRRVSARVARRAPTLDLALLTLSDEDDASGLAARIGDSDTLRVGDLVVALGNPMGERNAPSVGIVASAPGDVLRLAITLRPGNSGGALVNARGEVVGIPHMVTGSGLALAVSTRTVRRFLSGSSLETEDPRSSITWI
jgi:serine protease Do